MKPSQTCSRRLRCIAYLCAEARACRRARISAAFSMRRIVGVSLRLVHAVDQRQLESPPERSDGDALRSGAQVSDRCRAENFVIVESCDCFGGIRLLSRAR